MKIGDVVEHRNKESNSGYPHDKTYKIIDIECRMKCPITGLWIDAVIYESENSERYVREYDDFIVKFQKVEIYGSKD